jgi:hypothetical protein
MHPLPAPTLTPDSTIVHLENALVKRRDPGSVKANIEFSCRPDLVDYLPVRRTAFFLSRPHPGGQLQRFVRALPELAEFTPVGGKASIWFISSFPLQNLFTWSQFLGVPE